MSARSKFLTMIALACTLAVPAYAKPYAVPVGPAEIGSSFPAVLVVDAQAPANDFIARVAQADDAVPEIYRWSAAKANDQISIAGSAPNSAIKSFLNVRAGGEVSDKSTVRPGAPESFIDYSVAGITALGMLIDGRVAYTGSKWTLGGHAASQESLDETITTLSAAVDMADWVIFLEVAASDAPDEATPETVDEPAVQPEPLRWAVSKSKGGELTLTGNLPNPSLQSYLRVRAGEGAIDNTGVGGSAPDNFIDTAIAALDAVRMLDRGRVAYTGSKWTIGGFAESQEAIDSILESLGEVADLTEWVIFIQVTPDRPETAPEAEEEAGASGSTQSEPAGEMAATEPAEAESVPAVVPEYQFNALKADGAAASLSGDVPSQAFGRYATIISGGQIADGEFSGGGLSINENAPENFIDSATAGIRALNSLESGLLAYENGDWALIGDALNDADAATAAAAISALPDGDSWTLDIAVIPAFELCAEAVTAFSDSHTILFAAGSSNLTPESASALRDLAAQLLNCPNADLQVEGHTDADGPEDSNMALSVARAEAVISELVKLGLDDTRLYAIGYGETLPVASNDTSAGKAQNRRIVFRLVAD